MFSNIHLTHYAFLVYVLLNLTKNIFYLFIIILQVGSHKYFIHYLHFLIYNTHIFYYSLFFLCTPIFFCSKSFFRSYLDFQLHALFHIFTQRMFMNVCYSCKICYITYNYITAFHKHPCIVLICNSVFTTSFLYMYFEHVLFKNIF